MNRRGVLGLGLAAAFAAPFVALRRSSPSRPVEVAPAAGYADRAPPPGTAGGLGGWPPPPGRRFADWLDSLPVAQRGEAVERFVADNKPRRTR